MNHQLSLEAPDTLNKCILRIVDTSTYLSRLPVRCPILQITVPGFDRPVVFDEAKITPEFNLNLTACDLELQTEGCGSEFMNLPDGIYIIKYSVSPNDQVFVEYNHLRITCALKRIQEIYCDLDLAACDPPEKVKKTLSEIQEIEQYLKAAKAYVEFCHTPEKGIDLYRYAVKLLGAMTCSSCSIC